MSWSAVVGLLAVGVLLVANGFFVATEFAIVAVRRSRLEQLVQKGHPGAAVAKHMVDHLDAYIAACQLGITMASLALGWIGEPVVAGLIEPPLERLVGRIAPAAAHGVAIGVSFALITALHIVAGELAPKGIALQRPEGTTLWVARPMRWFYAVFRWPITVLNATGNGLLRLLGLRAAAGHELVHTPEELELLLRASQRAGMVEESEARIAARAFNFADLTASDLMTPRGRIEAIPAGIGFDAFVRHIVTTQHGRLPVYDGSLENILGMVRVRDALPLLARPPDGFDLSRLLRPILIVPESRRADDLLEDMRRTGRHLAVIVDEYGGTAGLVALADLMRALVGPIEEGAAIEGVVGRVQVDPDGSMLLDGLMRRSEFEELIGTELRNGEMEDVATLGGLVMARLDRIPQAGDSLVVAGRTLRVEQIEGRRVARLRLMP